MGVQLGGATTVVTTETQSWQPGDGILAAPAAPDPFRAGMCLVKAGELLRLLNEHLPS